MGYDQAGFQVTGVDKYPQPKYPFKFIQADAFEVLGNRKFIEQFAAIHASPVCKGYSTTKSVWGREYPDDIASLRAILIEIGKPYSIENVKGAPLLNYVLLCGTMFGLNITRHRLFECYPQILFPPASCGHRKRTVAMGRRPDREKEYPSVVGHFTDVEFAQEVMGIDWLGQKELSQAIPPAYTKWIGEQIISNIPH